MAGVFHSLRRIYLTLYNWILFFGWSQVLFLSVKSLKSSGHQSVYAAVETHLILAQSAALLEILHSMTGIVRSPATTTLAQVGSRMYVTLGILRNIPEIRAHFLVAPLVTSWSVTEIIRYSFYGMKEAFGAAPAWLLWLRYSTFLVLYLTGISSEVGLIYGALPDLRGLGVRMPNRWNFSIDYYYAAIVILGLYVPGSPYMYRYMLGQRKRALAKNKTD